MSKINAPNRRDMHVLDEGEAKLTMEEDTKIPNAATVTINKEDHTLAGMLRSQLLSMPAVLFAGYRLPHPLEPRFLLKLQTDGSITPLQAIRQACNALIVILSNTSKLFTAEVRLARAMQEENLYDDVGY